MTDNKEVKSHVANTLKGMIVRKDTKTLFVSIVGKTEIYRLDNESYHSILEPLTRIEFLGHLNDEHNLIILNEMVAFNNALKIKFRSNILSLMAEIQKNIDGEVHVEKPYFELQDLLKQQHIPFTLYGFNDLKNRFWLNDICICIKQIQDNLKNNQLTEALRVKNKIAEKRGYYLSNNPDLKVKFSEVCAAIDSYKLNKGPSTNINQIESTGQKKKQRILIRYEDKMPLQGEILKVSFLEKLGPIRVNRVGNKFPFNPSSKSIPEAIVKVFKPGEYVCYLYYEPDIARTVEAKIFPFDGVQPTTPITANDFKFNEKSNTPKDTFDFVGAITKIQLQFEIDGIKPRQSFDFKSDVKNGKVVCDLRKISGSTWFIIGHNYIWFLTNKPSSDQNFYNLNFDGVNVAGWVLSRLSNKNIEDELEKLNKFLDRTANCS